jgi:hypothetical protein
LIGYSEGKKGKKSKGNMIYLPKFLEFTVKNLNTYNEKIQTPEGADWRIKEALLWSISSIKDEICSDKNLKS